MLRAVSAGMSWALVIASAPWAVRFGHTSVIDAAGAIYVIGGTGYPSVYNDVWVSTDKGAIRIRVLEVLVGDKGDSVVRGRT